MSGGEGAGEGGGVCNFQKWGITQNGGWGVFEIGGS